MFDKLVNVFDISRLLLRLDPAPAEYETDIVEIFGFSWVTETALVQSTKLLFGLFRYKDIKHVTILYCSLINPIYYYLIAYFSFCTKDISLKKLKGLFHLGHGILKYYFFLLYFRQKIYKMETLVQLNSRDFGKVLFMLHIFLLLSLLRHYC